MRDRRHRVPEPIRSTGRRTRTAKLRERQEQFEREMPALREVYRDLAYVRHECEQLAEQLRNRASAFGIDPL